MLYVLLCSMFFPVWFTLNRRSTFVAFAWPIIGEHYWHDRNYITYRNAVCHRKRAQIFFRSLDMWFVRYASAKTDGHAYHNIMYGTSPSLATAQSDSWQANRGACVSYHATTLFTNGGVCCTPDRTCWCLVPKSHLEILLSVVPWVIRNPPGCCTAAICSAAVSYF